MITFAKLGVAITIEEALQILIFKSQDNCVALKDVKALKVYNQIPKKFPI